MSEDDAVEVESPGEPDATADADASETADTADTAEEAGTDGTDAEPALADRVAEHDEALAEEVADLESELEERREEVDELTSKLARVRADFSNYKQRAKRKREEIRERASESLVERIAPVRNDLVRALDQEDGSDIRPGVESTLEKFDEVLDEEGVEPIEPEPGEEVDPARHQVMLRVDSDQPDGTVHEVYEPGYEMGDRVISEAQVTVSNGGE
ncbi:molecular chaperone GrpE [Halorubrum aquaticum]|uniref:Protein GrpE n=1 Tax=Halorubrum aquaticum TaxID=387340 RepID=A0A1I2Z2I0_9EURY|nr:nucleotide exchange factor GrpE [Halorubrum aquaticum]SFH31191.1 molecular chaperone GrpE [Halorubrum aquaticum]